MYSLAVEFQPFQAPPAYFSVSLPHVCPETLYLPRSRVITVDLQPDKKNTMYSYSAGDGHLSLLAICSYLCSSTATRILRIFRRVMNTAAPLLLSSIILSLMLATVGNIICHTIYAILE